MTNANLYCYASSKRALYHDSVAYGLTKWQTEVINSVKDIHDPVQRVISLCDNAVLYLSKNKTFCQVLELDPDIFPMYPKPDPFEEINSRSIAIMQETLQKGIDTGVFNDVDITNSTHLLFNLYKMIIIEGYIQMDNKEFLEAYQQIRDVVLYGIVKRNKLTEPLDEPDEPDQ